MLCCVKPFKSLNVNVRCEPLLYEICKLASVSETALALPIPKVISALPTHWRAKAVRRSVMCRLSKLRGVFVFKTYRVDVMSGVLFFIDLNTITLCIDGFIFSHRVCPNGGCAGLQRWRDAPQTPRNRHAPVRHPALPCRQLPLCLHPARWWPRLKIANGVV